MTGDLNLENLWDRLLSRQEEMVRAAFSDLDQGEKKAVLTHLRQMATEPGWHSQQRESARAALRAWEK